MSIKVMLWYDVEDYVTPEADEALLELIEMMDSLGVRSSLKMVGEKARVLSERGRDDILRLIAGHEVCYHTKDHSVHPTSTEYCEGMGFKQGAEAFLKYEQSGLDDVRVFTGQYPTSYGQPGASWAPQVFPVIRQWGFPHYLDVHDMIDMDGRIFWYGGALTLNLMARMMRFEHKRGGPDEMERAKKAFAEIVSGGPYVSPMLKNKPDPGVWDEKNKLVSIFYHPCEFSCEEFWDGVNFRHGKNPDGPLKPAPACSAEDRRKRVANLREFLEYTLTFPDVEYITASQSSSYEIVRSGNITLPDVKKLANKFDGGVTFEPMHEAYLAPSEIFSLYARAIAGKHLIPELLYGPEEDVPSELNGGSVKVSELAKAAMEQYDTVFGYKQLKKLYAAGSQKLNPLDMFSAMACAIKEGTDTVAVTPGSLLKTAERVNPKDDYRNVWLFGPDLTIPGIIRHTKLQCWTLKPAVF